MGDIPTEIAEALIRLEEDDYPRAPWGRTQFGQWLHDQDEKLCYEYWKTNVKDKEPNAQG